MLVNIHPFLEEDTGANAGGGEEQKFTIGEKEYTPTELAEMKKSYDKLQAQFTKVSQENSELKKAHESVKSWVDFDNFIQQYPPDVQQKFIENVNTFFSAVQSGNVQQKDITGLDKAIKSAEKAGDTKTADALSDVRDDALAELLLDKEINSIGKQAKKDGVEFDPDAFNDYFVKYLEDEGYTEDDDVEIEREVRRAYRLYRAEQKEKAADAKQKGDLPNVGTGGTGVGVGATKQNKAPKNLKEAFERVSGVNWG